VAEKAAAAVQASQSDCALGSITSGPTVNAAGSPRRTTGEGNSGHRVAYGAVLRGERDGLDFNEPVRSDQPRAERVCAKAI
jgi:hypothetical protein